MWKGAKIYAIKLISIGTLWNVKYIFHDLFIWCHAISFCLVQLEKEMILGNSKKWFIQGRRKYCLDDQSKRAPTIDHWV